ncbi:MAG: methyltransferase [Planctomycetota bacterium]
MQRNSARDEPALPGGPRLVSRGSRFQTPAADARPQGLPAPWSELEWRPLAAYRHAGKARLYWAQHGDRLVVCKDASAVNGLAALYRRWVLRNEARTLRALVGEPGVPELLAAWRGGLVMSHLPGVLLSSYPRGTAPAQIFDRLDTVLAAIHARGVRVGDLHRRNILVAPGGAVSLVDFELAVTPGRPLARLLGGMLRRLDEFAAARQRAYHGHPLSARQAAALARAPWIWRAGRWLRKHGLAGSLRVAAILAVVACLALVSQPTLTSVLSGLPLVLLGLGVRAWAAGHLLKSKELAQSGPYRHVQNPLYFGRLCLLTGFAIMAYWPWHLGGAVVPGNAVIGALLWAVFFGYYLPRKRRVEGQRLLELHGEAYRAWTEAVPLIWPRLRPHGASTRRWSAARFTENQEGLMIGLVTLVCALLAWRAAGLS